MPSTTKFVWLSMFQFTKQSNDFITNTHNYIPKNVI